MAMAWRKDDPSLPLRNFIDAARRVRDDMAHGRAGTPSE
jgi:hypothetical protein